MDFDVDVLQLSPKFASDYPSNLYPEIMYKSGRPYNCLLIDTHQDYFVCIPFRSHINHSNAFMFHNSQRSMRCRSGLDYSKTVIISDMSYIDSATAIVDQDEYTEAMQNINTISQKVLEYVDNYINHINGSSPMHIREFQRKYQYTSLQYFHNILGIQSPPTGEADRADDKKG